MNKKITVPCSEALQGTAILFYKQNQKSKTILMRRHNTPTTLMHQTQDGVSIQAMTQSSIQALFYSH